jgi:RNA polymerase sigma-70 factor (ECF subfamily)
MKDDRTLIGEFLGGDQQAFDELVLRYQEDVRRFLFRATRDVEDTNDLAQDVFIKVYHGLGSFRGESRFATWLYRISTNVLNSHFRKQRLRSWLPLGEHPADEPTAEVSHNALHRNLLSQLPRLSKQERQVVILRGLQELSVADTARILDTSENVVKVAYHTARKKLKGWLDRG